MIKRMCEVLLSAIVAGVLYSACGVAQAPAQNPTCPTRPVGDNSNACASTAFVKQNSISVSCSMVGDFPIWSGTVWVCSNANTSTSSASLVTTNPGARVNNTTFASPSAATSIPVGFSSYTIWQTGIALGGVAVVGQSIIESTAPNDSIGGVFGGALNKSENGDPYGVLGVMNNLSSLTSRRGAAVWGVIRGSATGTAGIYVDALRATSEADAGEHPRNGVNVINSLSTNAFLNGALIGSAVDYGVRVGLTVAEGAGFANVITPTKPFAFLDNTGTELWGVTSTGLTNAQAYNLKGNSLAVVSGNFTKLLSQDGAAVIWLGTAGNNITYDGAVHVFRNEAGSHNNVLLGAGGVQINGATSGSVVLAVPSAAGTPTVTFGSSSGTPAVTASSPLSITTATGNITCATCATTAGANIPSIATGDLLYGSASNTLSVLADVALLNVLISGGVGVAPSWGKVALGALATQATNTVLANATSGTAVPTALAVSSCSTASSALIWTTNSGFGCNTSITAAAVPVGGITGLGSGVATWLATPSSANLATALTDETGSGAAVFGTSPVLSTVDARGTWTTGTSWTLPAHTLGGTVSGGGNQINNVVIGASNPLAGSFTSITGTGQLSITQSAASPLAAFTTNSASVLLATWTQQAAAGAANFQFINDLGHTFSFGVGGSTYAIPDVFFLYSAGFGTVWNVNYTTGVTNFGAAISVGGSVTATLTNTATTSAVCYNTGTGLLTYNATVGTCTVSALVYKDLVGGLEQFGSLRNLRTVAWRYKKDSGFDDGRVHVGLLADDVAKMDKRCGIYDEKGKLINYEDRCVLAYLKADNDNLHAEIETIKRKVAR